MQNLLLLSKDTVIAKIINGVLEPLESARLPLFLQRTGDVRAWLESRAIDSHRTHSRLLKKVLRLEHKDNLSTVLSVNAATITDNYWVRPIEDTATRYADIRFEKNLFDNLALTGDINSFDQPPSRTPELTNIGSFEKCWRLISRSVSSKPQTSDSLSGKNDLRAGSACWWMIKSGSQQELFSELLAYRLGTLLKLPVAYYEPAGDFIASRDFTDNGRFDFESAAGIIGDVSDYVKIYDALNAIDPAIAEQYVLMCYFDGLIYNADRHEHNFGVLRDSDTGKSLSLAPFFDHNIALVALGYPKNIKAENDLLIGDFTLLARHIGRPVQVRAFSRAEIQKIIRDIPFELPVTEAVPDPRKFVAEYLLNRQARLLEQNRDILHIRKSPKAREL